MVSGRLVNVYSENDFPLAFLYRASSAHLGVAGLRKTEFVKGVENVDVSDAVSGHLRYRYLTGAILRRIGFEDIDMEEVGREEAEMKAVEELEKREAEEHEQKFSKDGKPLEEDLQLHGGCAHAQDIRWRYNEHVDAKYEKPHNIQNGSTANR